tara:strand:- start:250 stop:507 length:258 start_codon:yes stop_codon:yes gene_type:complete
MIDYKDLIERVVSTFIQATGGMIAVDQIVDMGADQWKLVLGAGGAAVLSMLKGYFAARFTGDNSCSLITAKNQDHELAEMYGEEG